MWDFVLLSRLGFVISNDDWRRGNGSQGLCLFGDRPCLLFKETLERKLGKEEEGGGAGKE